MNELLIKCPKCHGESTAPGELCPACNGYGHAITTDGQAVLQLIWFAMTTGAFGLPDRDSIGPQTVAALMRFEMKHD